MNIFYSWQSDTPDKVGRDLIRQSLEMAIDIVSDEMDLDESDRFYLDQDTKGILGSPPIADTILEKIAASNIFVADVTLVGEVPGSKKLINSNVAYELGYAHGKLSDKCLLKIMNTYYGSPEELPFDLKHRRWPVLFSLAPDATKEERREARKSLSKNLRKILADYLSDPATNQAETYRPIEAGSNRAIYWDTAQPLIANSSESYGYFVGQPLIYLHIWPDKALSHLTGIQQSGQGMPELPVFLWDGQKMRGRNKYGFISYASDQEDILVCSSQLFENKEVWCLNTYLLSRVDEDGRICFPTGTFEEKMNRHFAEYIKLTSGFFEYGKTINVEFGMVNVNGMCLGMSSEKYWSDRWGEVLNDFSIKTKVNAEDPKSIQEALLAIFEKVFDAAGQARPKD